MPSSLFKHGNSPPLTHSTWKSLKGLGTNRNNSTSASLSRASSYSCRESYVASFTAWINDFTVLIELLIRIEFIGVFLIFFISLYISKVKQNLNSFRNLCSVPFKVLVSIIFLGTPNGVITEIRRISCKHTFRYGNFSWSNNSRYLSWPISLIIFS